MKILKFLFLIALSLTAVTVGAQNVVILQDSLGNADTIKVLSTGVIGEQVDYNTQTFYELSQQLFKLGSAFVVILLTWLSFFVRSLRNFNVGKIKVGPRVTAAFTGVIVVAGFFVPFAPDGMKWWQWLVQNFETVLLGPGLYSLFNLKKIFGRDKEETETPAQ